MKHLITLLTIILFSQMANSQKNEGSYEVLWENVAQFEKEALTKSALGVVEKISKKAHKENNTGQIIKSLLYTSKYALTLEEDAQLRIVNDFKQEILKAAFPTKNILESYLANLYWQYFQQNRYQFYHRTKTETKIDPVDFRTWDLMTLFTEINLRFKNSLTHPESLQQIPIDTYKDILNEQKGPETYRPTLFDILAHTALDFYKTQESDITRPANKFEIDDPSFLGEVQEFIKVKSDTEDKTSLQAQAIATYQQLLAFHLENNNPEAMVDVDIERLQYVHQYAVFPDKDSFYLKVLQQSSLGTAPHATSALYRHETALLYRQWGNTYHPKTQKEHQKKLKEAVALCDGIIKEFPKSKAADKSRDLKATILSKNLELTAEKSIPTDQPSRILVNYKNHDHLQFSAFKISPQDLKELHKHHPEPKKLAFIKKLELVKSWDAVLKNEGDHQNHSTEVLLPALGNGLYLILATPKDQDPSFAYSDIQVTDLALVETRTSSEYRFQVIDRNDGQPKKGAQLQLTYKENYDRGFLTKTYTTDALGQVLIPLSSKRWTSVRATITAGDDTAYFGDYFIDKEYDQEDHTETTYNSFLFTDRSIYRPGQPLYFKGIAILQEKSGSNVQPNTAITVTLLDANGQEVSSQELRTNEFGSFTGEFILPNNGLTGRHSLQVRSKAININGGLNFSVEEYKRPKFETSFDPITATVKINDSVIVSGKAMAYAGSAITDAKVTYRVKRIVDFPRWYFGYRPYFNGAPQEITHGETTTDASGNYQFKFMALPDMSVAKESVPTFNYEISADVTDINGETHSTMTTVRVGYHALTANIVVGETLDKDKKDHTITVYTNNLNGQFVPAKGTLKIYKLKSPAHVLRNRPWEAPDYPGFNEGEFRKLFPHDAYANEHDQTQWENGPLVLETSFDTGTSMDINLGSIKKWVSGKYRITLETKDKFGQTVKDLTHMTLFSEKDNSLPDNQLFHIKTDKDHYAIGDKAVITFYSNAEMLNVRVMVEKDRKIIQTQLVTLGNGGKKIVVPVTEEDLGGFSLTYSFSAYNSFYTGVLPISIPYPKTDLEIETLTFRDKIKPGTDETWSFEIKGPKGEKVAAEVLANMYDASLDAFKDHSWGFNPLHQPIYYSNFRTNADRSFGNSYFFTFSEPMYRNRYKPPYYNTFNWFGLQFGNSPVHIRGLSRVMKNADQQIAMEADPETLNLVVAVENTTGIEVGNEQKAPITEEDKGPIQIRKNLQETAFFFPQLHTDKEGHVSFSFTTPEALTQWKLQLLAHTKSLQSAMSTLETVTQKELMVTPNVPRFLRAGDQITISTKIANLTEKKLTGQAEITLTDVISGKQITNDLLLAETQQISFSADALGNTQVSWTLKIPANLQALQYRIIAKAGDFSDGEQNVLPVLTNRMLVTETLPMWVGSNQSKTFTLDKLKDPASTTLENHKLTLEITSNPAWYAVQALPYLMEFPYDCNEQVFSRYYANTLASHIVNSSPRIKEVFDQWAHSDALLSNLEKNQELKALLIQETPWLRDAQSETEQKKRIALLFDLNQMQQAQAKALNQLKQNQMSNGAWAWFKGGRENRFITQHIITGLGHLKKLSVHTDEDTKLPAMTAKAIHYLDEAFMKEYEQMNKHAKNIDNDHLTYLQMHYLYMRSFFPEIATSEKLDAITSYYLGQAKKYWIEKSLYAKGILALVLHRKDDNATASKILRSLKDNSIVSGEMGMYWKENTPSWSWYQAPVETQALLIEAFSEISDDSTTVDKLKIWLLKNKQTNQWKSTKATTDAVYALLRQGSDWLSVTDAVDILVGGKKIEPSKMENIRVEAGTGYFKTSWNNSEINTNLGEVQLTEKGEGIVWGALYWQYFEDLDNITPSATPIQLKKKLFLRTHTDTGEEISEITPKTNLKVGDLVRVRIELRADRNMEFVHMKDMRAAGLEPINVLSQYKWQDGLGYYESTKDASTDFFFDSLPKGIYVFEYDLNVNNAGDFSTGITTIQSMYAPEFSSHSEGQRINITLK
ncbi:alpha-2-macroglobulin family protein [Maribacter polysaccharolyticus]|uniref:alpha-2-macroglobulin family protein n=1 Tax=Maribacter polysaccharolyticus TaxID=3020831 RepID=UPI00237F40C6|nr:alpha-2-macroglobulin family protein [Maribacter polysaccharolyticus]MDE3741541.1 alpha-2-macroglobulin family protein [Maribacter polysaccharolyticus]